MQTKKRSLLESITNVAIGFGVAVLSQQIVFPIFGYDVPLRDDIGIALFFTVISIVRSYTVRRIYNWWDSFKENK